MKVIAKFSPCEDCILNVESNSLMVEKGSIILVCKDSDFNVENENVPDENEDSSGVSD